MATPLRPTPLRGRVALVTGVSRPGGIAVTVAERLHHLGAVVVATGWPAHDDEMPWETGKLGALPFRVDQHDLKSAAAASSLIDDVFERHGRCDIVVATHARSSSGTLAEVTAEELDSCWAVNVRSIVMLAQRFAARHVPSEPTAPPQGRLIWFTSGQHLGPMDGELAYAISKGALEQMTLSLSAALSSARIVANCINPGPVDTGYATGATHAAVAEMFPDGRWGSADDVANLVAFLVSDEGAWIRGQVLNSEGGFRR